jgi:Peptidase family S41
MFVSRNLSTNATLAPGTEVLAINGIPARDVLQRLMKVARADGDNDAKRRALLEVQGIDRYEPFDIYYALYFPLRTPQFELSVRDFGAATNSMVAVNPLSYAGRLAAIKVSPEKMKGDDAVWTLSFLNDCTALLKMPTWALYNSKWDWKGFLTETFSSLNSHAHCSLIIDLRDNEGGMDIGDMIIRHLIKKPTAVSAMKRYTIQQ